jgi:hypothetical protein
MREFTCSVGIIATCINFSCLVSVQTLTLSVGRIAPRPGGVIVLRYGLSLLASVPQTPSQRCAIANLQERFHPIQRQPSHQSPQRSNHMGFANDRILCFFRTEYVDVVHWESADAIEPLTSYCTYLGHPILALILEEATLKNSSLSRFFDYKQRERENLFRPGAIPPIGLLVLF